VNTKSAQNEYRLRTKEIQKRQVNAGRWAMKRGLEIAVTISYNRMCQTKKRVCAYWHIPSSPYYICIYSKLLRYFIASCISDAKVLWVSKNPSLPAA